MAQASKQIENQAFAERLRQALKGIGVRPSPTLVANEFNLRYWGKSITSHTARNWLLGVWAAEGFHNPNHPRKAPSASWAMVSASINTCLL
jgi:hypothetical protein